MNPRSPASLSVSELVMLQGTEHRLGHADIPVFAVVFVAAVRRPDLEHDVERFSRHLARFALDPIDAEQLPIAGQSARADAQHVTTLGEVIHEGDAACEFGRVMIRQQMRSGGEFDSSGLHQRLRDQQIRRGIGLPRRGKVLTDPRLRIAQAVGRTDNFEIPFLSGF